MDNHIKSKKHLQAEAKFKQMYQLDDETEMLAKKDEEQRNEEDDESPEKQNSSGSESDDTDSKIKPKGKKLKED